MGAASSVSLIRYVNCYNNKQIRNNDNDYNSIVNINQNNDKKGCELDEEYKTASSSNYSIEHFEGIITSN